MEEKLITAAKDRLLGDYSEPRHTVSAAALLNTGETLTSINSFHYSGFLCAETSLLNLAIDQRKTIEKIVCVKKSREDGSLLVVNSCGKCRQILIEYCPDIKFLMQTKSGIKELSPDDVLPHAYVRSSR